VTAAVSCTHPAGTADALAIYRDHAAGLVAPYDAIPAAEWYQPVRKWFPPTPASVIDIGAGTGRDAAWLGGLGYAVTAVEPVAAFRAVRPGLRWVEDAMPDLPDIRASGARYDLILLSAVWHHLNRASGTARQGSWPGC
jgi:SAM-dependent methyltransferase